MRTNIIFILRETLWYYRCTILFEKWKNTFGVRIHHNYDQHKADDINKKNASNDARFY